MKNVKRRISFSCYYIGAIVFTPVFIFYRAEKTGAFDILLVENLRK